MRCEALDEIIAELGRDASVALSQRMMLEAHAVRCERCASRLAEERQLTAALRSLACADANARTPTRVEDQLRATFRRQHRAPPTCSPTRSWLRSALAAALLVLALFFIRPEAPVPHAVPAAPATAEAQADGFIPIRLADSQPNGDGVWIARVEMAPQALAALGLPLLVEVETDRPIMADILLGQDGLAQAIRFVR